MNGGEVEFLRPHLNDAGLTDDHVDDLVRRWTASSTASFIHYLGDVDLMPMHDSRQLALVFKGYLSAEVSSLLASLDISLVENERAVVPESDVERELELEVVGAPDDVEHLAPDDVENEHGDEHEDEGAELRSMSLSAFVHGRDEEAEIDSHLAPSPSAPIQLPPGVHRVPEVPTTPLMSSVPPAAVSPLAGAFASQPSDEPAPPDQTGELPPGASGPPPLPAASEGGRPRELEAGAMFGRYRLQEMLGEGSTSRIFRSFHETLVVPVALKVYRPTSRVSSAELQSKFVNEARMLARLDHPNIVRVLDVDVVGDLPFIVFEYVGAMTLEELAHATGKLPADRVARVGIQVADALAYAAEHNLLHRDVKPANVLLRKDATVKLADFGLATVGDDGGEASICGSPAYMAPEQILDPTGVDHRADMYGLGATLYHAAVGNPPFVRSSPKETLRAQIHELPVPPCELDPTFDEALSNLIMRLLEKKADNRFSSWPEVCAALRTCLSIVTEGSARHHPRRDSSRSTGPLKRVMSSLLGPKT